jgi:hypothetical protein
MTVRQSYNIEPRRRTRAKDFLPPPPPEERELPPPPGIPAVAGVVHENVPDDLRAHAEELRESGRRLRERLAPELPSMPAASAGGPFVTSGPP